MATDVKPLPTDMTEDDGNQIRWAAVSGLWSFNNSSAKYLGPSQGMDSPQPYGLALTNRNLTDGIAKVRVNFSQVDTKGLISAGLVLGFQSERARYVLVQLGAYGRAYSVAEHVPGFGWQTIENVGSAQNLVAGKDYALELRQLGQEVRLRVDGVSVLERLLPQPLTASQVGLFAWGKSGVSFSGLSIESANPLVFVAMQFGSRSTHFTRR